MLRNTKPRAERSLLLHLIPQEILTQEILPWLPVKSLLRFKCVSKSWQSLIESDRFMKIQYRNSRKNPRVMLDTIKECSLKSFLETRGGAMAMDEQTDYGPTTTRYHYKGCCNGVFCFYDKLCGLFLWWNPATRAANEFPRTSFDMFHRWDSVKSGFGWDESSGAYKVFDVMSTWNIVKIYSSKTKSWRRTTKHGALDLFHPVGQFVGGKLHWATWYGDGVNNYIESMDMESEEFGMIELPLIASKGRVRMWLGEIGGCLSILLDFKKSLEVWVMKEYGVKGSWFKLISFPIPLLRAYSLTPLFGKGPNGEIFVVYGHTIVVYSPKDDVFTTTKSARSLSGARIYVESFVSLR